MKKLAIIGAVAAVLAVVFVMAARMAVPDMPEDLDVASRKPSANGLYVVAFTPGSGVLEHGAARDWLVTLTNREGAPVEGAEIAIEGGMPQHDHPLAGGPHAGVPSGDGRYLVEGLRFDSTGWWQVRVTVEAEAGVDAATFNIVL